LLSEDKFLLIRAMAWQVGGEGKVVRFDYPTENIAQLILSIVFSFT
jgi:hypothetical protein